MFTQKVHSTGVKNCSVFEATRGSQFYQICFVVRHLKYKSTSACLPPRIFGKLGCCIIRDYRKVANNFAQQSGGFGQETIDLFLRQAQLLAGTSEE